MTTPHRTLLQQALDALEPISAFGRVGTKDVEQAKLQQAITALREALAAPEPEPVAWYYVEDPRGANEWHFMTDSPESQECDPRDWTPLYATPPAAPAPAAPVPDGWVMVPRTLVDAAKRLVEHADFQLGGSLSADSKAREIPSNAVSKVKARHLASLRDRITELSAAPAQPVPLTQDQIADCTRTAHRACDAKGPMTRWSTELARAIEAAHGITGGKL